MVFLYVDALCIVLLIPMPCGRIGDEVLASVVDATIVTLPLKHLDMRIEEIRCDRLVVCLRRDNPRTTSIA